MSDLVKVRAVSAAEVLRTLVYTDHARAVCAAVDALDAKDAEISSLKADLSALREAVGVWQRTPHTSSGVYRCASWTGATCDCGADAANAARAEARKLAGLGE